MKLTGVSFLLLFQAWSDRGVFAVERRVRTGYQHQESIIHQSRYSKVGAEGGGTQHLQAPKQRKLRRTKRRKGEMKGPKGESKLKGETKLKGERHKRMKKGEKIQKKASTPMLSEGCDGLLQFDEINVGEYQEGDLSKRGERLLWSTNPMFDMDGDIVGSVGGTCTVIAMAEAADGSATATTNTDATTDITTDGDVQRGQLFCNTYYRWTSGIFGGSTLVAEGTYPDSASSTSYTILGGTGCFAGKSGLVKTQYIEERNSYRALIQFE